MRNKKILGRVKRLAASIAIGALVTAMLPVKSAAAATGTTTYCYDGYTVGYTVVNEWADGQSVEVKITNTGNESMYNWAFRYDAEGEIENIWNASVLEKNDTEYIVKNSGWNYEIAPNQSVAFGYILRDDMFEVPDKFELCSERVTVTDGYDAVMNVTNSWGSGFQGELLITNTSDSPLEAWTLTFETNFTIDNLWNARILEGENNHYTVSSEAWTNPIPVGGMMSIGFIGTKSANIEAVASNFVLTEVVIGEASDTPEAPEAPEVPDTPDVPDITEYVIDLTTDVAEIKVKNGYKTVYFYAHSDVVVETLSLIDCETKNVVANMVDDGNYSVSGDDMKGDGIFTCKLNLDVSYEKDYYFEAGYADSTIEVKSNAVNVFVYKEFTDEELEEMDAVDEVLFNFITSEEFAQLTIEQKQSKTNELLIELAQNGTSDMPYGLIFEESICYDEGLFTFTYDCGAHGAVKITSFSKELAGDAEEDPIFTSVINHSINETLPMDCPDDVSALILYGFDDATQAGSIVKDFEAAEAVLENAGVQVTLDSDVTVKDFKNTLEGNTFIVFALHGSYYTYHHGFLWLSSTSVPALCTNEAQTKEKNKEYSADIKKHRVEKVTTTDGKFYWILPDFFSIQYRDNELDDTYIFMGNCYGFGGDGKEDTSLAEALVKTGAENVVGFHNPVYIYYGKDMMLSYILNMLNGMTSEEALDDCKSKYGEDDISWIFNFHGITATDKEKAYPILYGWEDATLWNTYIKNGSFDDSFMPALFDTNISGWDRKGDTRLLSKLGNILPVHGKYMTIITTGVGSAENEYVNGTEGSYVSQRFKIPEGSTTLSFSYNFVSEEPMEYVGSVFDDNYKAQIYDVHGNEVIIAASESINQSTWYAVEGVNFDGGDSTAYQTGWVKVNVDVSKCAGAYITLHFGVADVGDSIYDSAVLIDNVNIS